MLVSQINQFYLKTEALRICQGDLLRNINFLVTDPKEKLVEEREKDIKLRYSVVMSQDCDLQWDFEWRNGDKENHDKLLPSILLCPAYPSEQFLLGNHIEGWKMSLFPSTQDVKSIKQNDKFNRYHFLDKDAGISAPELIIDFKHFYTVPTSLLYNDYKSIYLATINELFRERLSQRFANYLSRFGLPDIKQA